MVTVGLTSNSQSPCPYGGIIVKLLAEDGINLAASMIQPLRIFLLGSPQIYIGDTAIRGWPSRAAEAVIAYVVSAENPVPRSHLADLLWPKSDPQQARTNLRSILATIRKQLATYIVIDRHTVATNPEAPIWIDSVELTRAITPHATLKSLAQAVDLYHDSFLAGLDLRNAYPFDEWVAIQREKIERLTITALHRLASNSLQTGSYANGEAHAQRWLTLDQFSEDAMQTLLWLQLRQGRRNEALRQYATFVKLLEDELGIEPVAATQAVADRARRVVQLGATNIKPARSPFIGRQAELNTLLAQIRQPKARLTTLLGMGGMGKTRLAHALAQKVQADAPGLFLDGVWFIELAAVTSSAGMLVAIAEAIGLQIRQTDSAEFALQTHLREREMLLILDNVEQLADDAQALAVIADLLEAASNINLLITSRERLHLRDEMVVAVTGLVESAELFISYARRQKMTDWRRELTQVTSICAQLQHVPLAVELAAGWTRERSLRDIASSISESLDTLATRFRDVPERHRSVRAAFETSWARLDSDIQQHFATLSVFRGGFSAEAARAVTQTPSHALRQLADRSLLIYHPDSGRYSLHELLREYAREQLGNTITMQQNHADFFAKQVQEWFEPLRSARQSEVMEWFSVDFRNIERMWQHHITHNNRSAIDHCTLPIFTYLADSSQFLAGRALFSAALPTASVWVKLALGRMETELGQYDAARSMLDGCLELITDDAFATGFAQMQLATLAQLTGRTDDARAHVTQAQTQYKAAAAPLDVALCETAFGRIAYRAAEQVAMLAHYEKARDLLEPTGYARALAAAYHGLAIVTHDQGENQVAEAVALQSITLSRQLAAEDGVANTSSLLGQIYTLTQQYEQAEACLQEAREICERIGLQMQQGIALNAVGLLEQTRGDDAAALDYYQQAYRILLSQSHLRGAAVVANNIAEVAMALGREPLVDRYLHEALRLNQQTGGLLGIAASHDLLARRAVAAGQQAEAAHHLLEGQQATAEGSRRSYNLFATFGQYLHRFVGESRGWGVLYFMSELSSAEMADRDIFRQMRDELVVSEADQQRAIAWADELSADMLHRLFHQTLHEGKHS